jgi:translation initiation factor 4G
MDMLTKNVIRQCFVRLLSNVEEPDEEDIESTCKLLTTVGHQYETVSHDNMTVVFERLSYILSKDNIASRIRFMIMVSLLDS